MLVQVDKPKEYRVLDAKTLDDAALVLFKEKIDHMCQRAAAKEEFAEANRASLKAFQTKVRTMWQTSAEREDLKAVIRQLQVRITSTASIILALSVKLLLGR